MPLPDADWQFFRLLLLTALALCAAYAALVLGQATYADVQALGRITFHHGTYQHLPVRVSAAEFMLAQRLALGGAIGLGLLVLALAGRTGRRELTHLAAEVRRALAGAGRQLAALSRGQRWAAGLSLGLLTAVRLYFGLIKSYHAEEVATYDFFVSRGLLAASGFYPIPNNHVLSSTLGWLFYQLSPAPWFSLRLPVLLTATAGTVVLFVGLLRFGTFRAALVGLTLFSWLQLSLYNAAAGRGYWLLMTLAGLHFLALVALLARPAGPRVAWAVLLTTAILGLYTVPSFAYVVLSSTSYLGLVFGRRRAWAALTRTLALGAGGLAGAALLYGPLLLLSGWPLLLANPYVRSSSWQAVGRELPAFLWFTEGVLAGQRTIGAGLFIVGMGAFGWLWRARPQAALASDLHRALRQLGPPAAWFVLLPLLLLLLQRVLPPERVLLYKALFFFTIIGLLVDAGLRAHPGRIWPRLAGLGIALFVGYQTFTMQKLVVGNSRQQAPIEQAFAWLRRQPPGRVLIGLNITALHFLYLTHLRTPNAPWQLDTNSLPGARYRYLIVAPGYAGPSRPAFPARPAYADARHEIYVLPTPGQPLPPDPAWE